MTPQHTPAPEVHDYCNSSIANEGLEYSPELHEYLNHTPYTEKTVWFITTPQGTRLVPDTTEKDIMQNPAHLDEDWFVEPPKELQQLRDEEAVRQVIVSKLEAERHTRYWNSRMKAFTKKVKHNRKVSKLAKKARRK